MNPLYSVGLRELIQDPSVVEELDRISAYLKGALQGFGHVNVETSLEDGEDLPPTINLEQPVRIDNVPLTSAIGFLSGTGNPQGVQAAAVGRFYYDTNTGYLFKKCGGGSTAYGWYWQPPTGAGMDDGGPLWFGRQINDNSNLSVTGTWGIDTGLTSTSVTAGRTYVTGSGWFNSISTGAVINTNAHYNSQTGQVRWYEDDLDLVYTVRTGSDLTSQRLWCGVTTASLTDTDSAAGSNLFFRYSTAVPDAGWVGYTNDGAASSATSMIAAIAADTIYRLRIRFIRAGTPTVYFSVNDGTEVSKTTNLPATGLNSFWAWGITNKAAASRTLNWRSVHAVIGAQT